MIFDDVRNTELYRGISPLLDRVFDLIDTEDFASMPDGKYDVDGENLYYMVQRYATLPIEDGLFEAHRKYIDIQLVVSGSEVIGYANLDGLAVSSPYDETNDCELYERPEKWTLLECCSDSFVVLWPQDTHMPCRISEQECDVCKVVLKVRVDG